MIYGYIRVSTDRQTVENQRFEINQFCYKNVMVERNLISQRTKEALARKRAEGVILGRPKGSKSKVKKLTGKEAEIKTLLDKKISKSAIARILGVHRLTVAEFVKENL
jgi:DNA invertase Pin-like site-specific DNA recombinase